MSRSNGVWPWGELGLPGKPKDPKDVRRAYAKMLKSIDADNDVQAFEMLRQAYEQARRLVGTAQRRASVTPQERPIPDQRQPNVLAPSQKVPKDKSPATEVKSEEHSGEDSTIGPWEAPNYSDPQAVLHVAQSYISTNNRNPQDWLPLINASALSDAKVSLQFQWMLQDFLRSTPEFNKRVDLFVAIDDRFGWVSDGVGFLRKFPNAIEFQAIMADDLRAEEWRLKRNKVTFRKPSELGAKPIPMMVWAFTIMVWFVAMARSS